ncbi:MAG: hypothetical protein H8E34_13765 [Bacteroidetes bacterium]|nr:hypothetical protein [Bacteroidota bacterium]MBL6944233.1 hypothetical protein [Bacteroidales bacterium]
MKRFTLLFLGILLSANFLIAGGLVHNTNQSAAWSRMLSRGATVEIDAVYYNPAGLTKLSDGFHISLSSQSIFQTQTIRSSYRYLNDAEYIGKVSAPVFPSVYLAYKTGKFVFSFGFLPLGGGGGATFDRGVPMMEVPIASLVPAFSSFGVTGYSVDMEFQGSSVYWGAQAGISYAFNDNFSIFAGARYIMAKNTYTGYIRNITLKTAAGDMRADAFMIGVSETATNYAVVATGAAVGMQPIMDLGYGGLTWDEAAAYGVLTEEQILTLQGGLVQFGFSPEQVAAMNLAQAQGSYYGTASALNTQAAELRGGAALMGDQDGDITQTGNGITPIIGANFSFMENDLNVGLKYEFKTEMDLVNDVPPGKGFVIGMNPDGTPIEMFPDGDTINADLPAMLSVGVDYKVIEDLRIAITYHTYFDKKTGWAKEANQPWVIDKNFWELGIGFEYSVNDKFLLSTGYLRAQTGVNQHYQSNLSYSLTTNTVALGAAYKINDTFKLNLGGYLVSYDKAVYNMYEGSGNNTLPYYESYLKSTFAVALGIDISLGSKK